MWIWRILALSILFIHCGAYFRLPVFAENSPRKFLTHDTTNAPVRKTSLCVALANTLGNTFRRSGIRQELVAEDSTAIRTPRDKAYDALFEFKKNRLQIRNASVEFKDIGVVRSSEESRKALVASRIQGIQWSWNHAAKDSEFRGAPVDNPDAFYSDLVKEVQFLTSGMADSKLVYSDGSPAPLSARMEDLALRKIVGNLKNIFIYGVSGLTFGASLSTHSQDFITAISFAFLIDLPVHFFYRSTQIWDRQFKARLKAIEDFRNGNEDWVYMTLDRRLYNREEDDKDLITSQMTPMEQAQFSKYVDGTTAFGRRLRRKNSQFVQYDLLFQKNPKTGEKEIFVYARHSNAKPQPPKKRKPDPEAEKERSLLMHPAVGVVPVR